MSLFVVRETRYLMGSRGVVITLDTPLGRKSFQSHEDILARVNIQRAADAAGVSPDFGVDLRAINWGNEDVLVVAKGYVGACFPDTGMSNEVTLKGA